MTTFTTTTRAVRIWVASAATITAIACGVGVSGGVHVMGSAPSLSTGLSKATSVKPVSAHSAELLGLIARTGNPSDTTQVSPVKFGTDQ